MSAWHVVRGVTRLAPTIEEEPLTPRARVMLQERALAEYLDRLDRKQWRDPATGRIISRRQRRVQVASTKWWRR